MSLGPTFGLERGPQRHFSDQPNFFPVKSFFFCNFDNVAQHLRHFDFFALIFNHLAWQFYHNLAWSFHLFLQNNVFNTPKIFPTNIKSSIRPSFLLKMNKGPIRRVGSLGFVSNNKGCINRLIIHQTYHYPTYRHIQLTGKAVLHWSNQATFKVQSSYSIYHGHCSVHKGKGVYGSQEQENGRGQVTVNINILSSCKVSFVASGFPSQ